MKTYYLLLLSILLLPGCQRSERLTLIDSHDKSIQQKNDHPGKELMEAHCFSCHGPDASHDDRIAPPMFAVKQHYLRNGLSKEEFIISVQNWVKEPDKDHARMFGAVERFGVMPKNAIPEEAVKQIADYLYENEIERPEQCGGNCSGNCGGKGKGKGMGKGKKHQRKYQG
ncbi:MAG: c-type cytochrome [Flavobacteriaceae bacterium]|nr:c-type cytochrome [Flavobacteriaceae bacterium]